MKNKIIYLFIILLCYCTKEHKTYNVNGVVISINESERSIIVDHDSIPGFMMPMVMPFNLKYIEAVKGINPNDSINFKFKITENSSYAYDFVIVGKRSKEIPLLEPGRCRTSCIDGRQEGIQRHGCRASSRRIRSRRRGCHARRACDYLASRGGKGGCCGGGRCFH